MTGFALIRLPPLLKTQPGHESPVEPVPLADGIERVHGLAVEQIEISDIRGDIAFFIVNRDDDGKIDGGIRFHRGKVIPP